MNNLLNSKNILKNNEKNRIYLTAYPNLLNDENNEPCTGSKRAFDIPFGSTNDRKQRIEKLIKYLSDPLYKIQKKISNEFK